MPAGILISASCCQVATGSLQAWISKVQAPGVVGGHPGVVSRSGTSASLVIRTGARRTPSGPVSTTSAPSSSCPSRKTRALTGKRLPDRRLGGVPTEVDDGRDVHDGDASDHGSNLPMLGPRGNPPSDRNGDTGRSAADATVGTAWIVQVDLRYGASRASHPPIHRPPRPARAARRARRARRQPALVLAPRDAGPLRASRPRAVGVARATTRSGCSARCRRPARGAGRRRGLPRPARRGARRPRRRTSPATAGTSARRRADGARARSRYFSPEFGITAVLPQYSGGLGILAGDHLKAASDLGVPIIGVGPALPARLLQAVAVPRGLAAGDLPGPRPRRPADLAAARAPTARARRSRSACPAGRR